MNCVICGKGFNAEFDPVLNLYPVYHATEDCPNEMVSCEARFYENLVQIYKCLHESDLSFQMNDLISKVKWGPIQMKRELIGFCLNQGYLDLDIMQRIIPQEAVTDLCNEVFESHNLENPENLKRAINYMHDAIRFLKDKLEAPTIDHAPEEPEEEEVAVASIGSSRRMFTIDISSRNHSPADKIEQRRGMYSR
jgi:hypothetical protein